MKTEKIEQLFRIADDNLKCNTAYPIFKLPFQKYESDQDIMEDVDELSFYIHIPFCKHLCKFCEYTRFLAGDQKQEERYLDLLEKQIREYVLRHKVNKIYGLDIGGGTPTALSDANFERLMKLSAILDCTQTADNSQLVPSIPIKVADFEKSIEISFTTITGKKIELIGQYQFHRVSAGIQSMSHSLLERYGREHRQLTEVKAYMNALYEAGVKKINLDFMYGMPDQNQDMLQGTIDAIQILKPEQVTLYEMRFNRIEMNHNLITRESQYEQYCFLYQELRKMGYHGRFGKNTFSLAEDKGVSSYIWYRMDQGIPYKGFGISAQSMGKHGISYGSMKNTEEKSIPELKEISTSSNYILPSEEMAAKYVSIGMYNSAFRMSILSEFLKQDASLYFEEEFRFLEQRKYIKKNGDYIELTEEGFRYYGAITTLFWSDDQKEALLNDKPEEKRNEI